MEIPLSARDQVNNYIRQNFIKIPEKISEFEKIARSIPIPPHHISPELGKLLMILVKSIRAKSILEIGTMWGYSTWWLYQGLTSDGKIITLDKDTKHVRLAKQFFHDMSLTDKVELRHVDALEELKKIPPHEFDFIFLDADKKEYPAFYSLIKNLLKPGGIMVVDNVIFSSAWQQQTTAHSTNNKSIQATQKFNKLIAQDKNFTAIPVAINSGIMVALFASLIKA